MSKRRNGVPVEFNFQRFSGCVIDLGWEASQPADTHWQARRGPDVFNLWPTTGKFQCGITTGRVIAAALERNSEVKSLWE